MYNVNNTELFDMTVTEMVDTNGGFSNCFVAGAVGVLTIAAVASGNILGAAVGGFATGYFGAGCYYEG